MGITSALLQDALETGTSAPNPRPTTSSSTTGRELGPVFQCPRHERQHPLNSGTFPSPRPTRVGEVPAPLPRPGCDGYPKGPGRDPTGHHHRCPLAQRRLESEERAGQGIQPGPRSHPEAHPTLWLADVNLLVLQRATQDRKTVSPDQPEA
ncbi:uncharacterized protein LOC135319227 isoform X2 [Camelus dromedarius]|uniref:uncharacterized protein LOC135319227 isoform X2 n=1 Tax=Camelus dromedarius TaxID=9838 RepID=UPI00311A0938